jgi:hypothetical protein
MLHFTGIPEYENQTPLLLIIPGRKAKGDFLDLGQYRTKGVSPESQEIFVRNKDKSTGIAALFRAFWTPFPR